MCWEWVVGVDGFFEGGGCECGVYLRIRKNLENVSYVDVLLSTQCVMIK